MWKILVVDDELAQRETLCRGIHLLGHICVSAANAAEALKVLGEKAACNMDVLITDLTMPGASGLQLIERALERWPNLRVLLITGLVAGKDAEAAMSRGIRVLCKPFSLEQLEQVLKTLR